jgi:hypothetical protein
MRIVTFDVNSRITLFPSRAALLDLHGTTHYLTPGAVDALRDALNNPMGLRTDPKSRFPDSVPERMSPDEYNICED